ncbi:MAG: sigma 54-interacting transcriptional regulator [Thermodesulfovibrionales bacterium]|nr:sigma 54-interacting transcriptional regulator [Thermodesulfovibrionales bacterium]
MQSFLKDKEFLKSILETMAEGLMVVDKDGNILFFNKAAERITGFKAKEVTGKPCTILNTDTCVTITPEGHRRDCKLFDIGCVTNKKCIIKSKDGTEKHILKNAVVLKDKKGNITGAVEVMTDVTSLYIKDREIEQLKNELKHEYGFLGIIGKSPPMQALFEQIKLSAQSDSSVLIYGESGTGKELVAEAIHKLSKRSKNPFIKVNCAAFNEYLLESELFGHVKGAFTGAIRDRVGRFEAANKGTIFLDEIGDIPQSVQVKLLRVIQAKEIERVGDNKTISIDVRFICATNKDMLQLLENGQFRWDLYYRINVIPIKVPPLRERKEDIPLLLSHYLEKINILNGKNIKRISPQAMELIESYDWPGNVRQLINLIEYSALTSKDEVIDVSDLPEYIFKKPMNIFEKIKNLKDREKILSVLSRYNWNRTLAAKHLGISRVTLWKLMKEYKIDEKIMIEGA